MNIRFKGPKLWRSDLVMMAGPSRINTPLAINGHADLVAACRKSKHELIRIFGVIIDPKSTKEEMLSINYDLLHILSGFSESDNEIEVISGRLAQKSELFTLEEARELLKSSNVFRAMLGVNHPELSLNNLVDLVERIGDVVFPTKEYALALRAADRLLEYTIEPKTLWQLADKCWEVMEYAIAEHPNTPVDLLQVLIARSGDPIAIDNARANLRRRRSVASAAVVFENEESRDARMGMELLRTATIPLSLPDETKIRNKLYAFQSGDPIEALKAAFFFLGIFREREILDLTIP